ncbi:hypothetical protein AQJ91_15780 [Streptomyces dysideae]|uniref:Uncharacterized protein n=1 Tax=Streptomyces dysideae TaxID=909626 RepID=A0A101V0J5_9ACTN|nr:hypothetical protein AQJ91_15780 [Streptomyces dysideae]
MRERYGLQIVVHPHADTRIDREENARFLDGTHSGLVSLCLDTGRYAYCGGDSVKLIETYGERIGYLHVNYPVPRQRQGVGLAQRASLAVTLRLRSALVRRCCRGVAGAVDWAPRRHNSQARARLLADVRARKTPFGPAVAQDVTFSAVNGRACVLGRSHLVALPTAPYDRTVTGRISPRSSLFRPVRGRVR